MFQSGDDDGAKVITVNCSREEKIAKALEKAEPGDTIRLTGTCFERVTITTNRITLDGQGAAILDGARSSAGEFDGVITIDGARGVIIQGLTVQHGTGKGVFGKRGAAFSVRNATLQDNGYSGIAVRESSTAEISDCRVLRNMDVGIIVEIGSSAVFKGSIEVRDNPVGGVGINGTSIVEMRGARVNVSNNAFGIIAGSNSQIAVFDFNSVEPTTITVEGNAAKGIALGDSVLNVFGHAVITVARNTFGIVVRPGTVVSPFASGTFLIENNSVGLDFRMGGGAIFRGGLTVRGNGTGVRTDLGAGVLWFISVRPNPSSITGNGVDVDLQFGARAIFDQVAVGTIRCDASVLTQGSTRCP
jgi:hypothetical protein